MTQHKNSPGDQQSSLNITKLVARLMIAMYLPAVAAAVISGVAYVEYFKHLGSPGLARFLALVVATAVGGGYMAIVHLLVNGAAKLPEKERAKLTPVIVACWILISLASAFPILINAGKGIAMKASAHSNLSIVMTELDRLTSATLAFDQIGPVLDNGIATLTSFQKMEIEGIYSGTKSEGKVARWITGFIERLREARIGIAQTSERINDLISRINRAIDKMRRAMTDSELNLDQKRAAVQRAGDEARGAMIALKQAAPTASLKNLASSLRSDQTPPRFSRNAKIRRGQQEGVRRIKAELRRIGRDLEQRVDDMAENLKGRISAYQPPPDSILVLVNLHAVPHVAAMAFGLDSMPFALYLIIARLYDAERKSRARNAANSSGWREGPSLPSPNNPLGSHPHPNATRSRSNDHLNNEHNSKEGSDQ